MSVLRKRILFASMTCMLLVTSACAGDGGITAQEHNQQRSNIQTMDPAARVLNNGTQVAVIEIVSQDGNRYIALDEMVNMIGFYSEWDETTQTYNIGDTDVIYQVKVNSTQAKKHEEEVLLSAKPILSNGKILIPIEAVELFQEYMNYEVTGQQLFIYPDYDIANNEIYNDEKFFSDDPADPAGTNEEFNGDALDIADISPAEGEEAVWSALDDGDIIPVFTRKKVNANRLIATGKKYLGVKYKFGAGKYRYTKRFDCSSFVQQLYNTYGVRLPRVSRSQAKYGVSVSRKNLRKGDLLYFYVPGRFKSKKTVGHVGIYIGGNKMLHSSPKPKDGVQITNINKAYWKRTYLGAKRVIR